MMIDIDKNILIQALDNLPVGALLIDARSETWSVVYANPVVSQLTGGIEYGDLVGRPWSSLLVDPEELAAQQARLVGSPALVIRQLRQRWQSRSGVPVDLDLFGAVGTDSHRPQPVVVHPVVALAPLGDEAPGHGDTTEDSHLALPRLPHGMDRLREVELPPFRAYAQAKLAASEDAEPARDASAASRAGRQAMRCPPRNTPPVATAPRRSRAASADRW